MSCASSLFGDQSDCSDHHDPIAASIGARTTAAIMPPCARPSSHLFRRAHLKWEGLKNTPEHDLHDLAYGLKENLEDHQESPCNRVKKPPVQKQPLITLVGKLTDGSYQRCKKAAEVSLFVLGSAFGKV
eukprot:4652364-Pyramimonas_sp.AAC.2